MKTDHTPEPLHYMPLPAADGTFMVLGGQGQDYGLVASCTTEEDARRIVACVNACAGIGTEYLEHFGGTSFNDFKRVKGQRDELLAALGSGGRHCNDDTPHSNLCEAIIDSKEADLGQGLDPFWKWAFRRGFHEAETSYKVDIATLEQQRDELLAELIHIQQVACSGSPELGIATNAIASVKDKQND